MSNPTIVLVHGAWVEGSSWNAVSTHLQMSEVPGSHVSMVSHPQACIDAILAAVAAVGG